MSAALQALTCRTCNGTGRNPMSDNVNWLPCGECSGGGNVLVNKPKRASRRITFCEDEEFVSEIRAKLDRAEADRDASAMRFYFAFNYYMTLRWITRNMAGRPYTFALNAIRGAKAELKKAADDRLKLLCPELANG